MGEFYQCKLRIHLNWWERRHLFSMWHLFTSFSDVFLITGSLLKILLQYNVSTCQLLSSSHMICYYGDYVLGDYRSNQCTDFAWLNTDNTIWCYAEILQFLQATQCKEDVPTRYL